MSDLIVDVSFANEAAVRLVETIRRGACHAKTDQSYEFRKGRTVGPVQARLKADGEPEADRVDTALATAVAALADMVERGRAQTPERAILRISLQGAMRLLQHDGLLRKRRLLCCADAFPDPSGPTFSVSPKSAASRSICPTQRNTAPPITHFFCNEKMEMLYETLIVS